MSALWDELHTRRPWRTAISATNLSSFEQRGVGDASEPKYLAVIAINTVCQHKPAHWKPPNTVQRTDTAKFVCVLQSVNEVAPAVCWPCAGVFSACPARPAAEDLGADGARPERLEDELGIVIRFIVGRS